MEKIKDLLKKMGISEDLQKSLIGLLENFKQEETKKHETLFNERLEKVKKVCIEETAKYKRELSKKVAIFFEARAQQVARSVERQLAVEGSEASNKLSRLKALLENVPAAKIGEIPPDVKKLSEDLDGLKQANAKLIEERDSAIRKANRSNEIANKILQSNRALEEKVAGVEKQLAETKKAPPAPEKKEPEKTVQEDVVKDEQTILEDLRQPAAEPKSTTHSAPAAQPGKKKTEIDEIADSIE